MLWTTLVQAYPTSVVFTPTAEAKDLGTVGVLAYTSTNLKPKLNPGSTWAGLEFGVLPQFKYPGTEVQFGGLELGADIITPYGSIVKPVLNLKLAPLKEGQYHPGLAVGLMEVSPGLPSMNFAYSSLTKSFTVKDVNLGRVTLGFGMNLGAKSQFYGTWPAQGTRLGVLLAYESPMLKDRVGLVVDHLGGGSEISSTYVGASIMVSGPTYFMVGGFFANDRRAPASTYDGLFGALTTTLDLK